VVAFHKWRIQVIDLDHGGFDFNVAARRPGPWGPGFSGGSERTRPTYYIEVETALVDRTPLNRGPPRRQSQSAPERADELADREGGVTHGKIEW